MEAYVADRAAPPMEAAVSNSNSKRSAILIILPKDHHLLQKWQHILLLQRTFETFLNRTQKSKGKVHPRIGHIGPERE
jgi:hypothetical protein